MKWALAVSRVSALLVVGCMPAHAATAQSGKQVADVVLTRVLYKPAGLTGWPVHSYYGLPIRSSYTLWYHDQTHWRLTGHYLAAPRDAFLLRNGSFGSPFFPFPGTVIQRGHVIWHYDARHHRPALILARSDGMNPMTEAANEAGLFLDRLQPGSLADLVRHERQCHRVTVYGVQSIAGRQADVLRLGPDACTIRSAAASDTSGPATAWVDARTYVLLRYDLYLPGGRRLLLRVTTTGVRYGVPIRPALLLPPKGGASAAP